MEANFPKALQWVRVSETGHTDSETNPQHWGNGDDPDDAGGRTSRGITQREYNAYCRMAGLPEGDVYKAPDKVVDDIYHRSYWMPYGPTLPPGVDYMFFDHCVLAGPGAAAPGLQRALNALGNQLIVDGHIGICTSEALSKADPAKLIDAMAADRMRYYSNVIAAHPQDRKFYRGWSNRVVFAKTNAHTLVITHGTV